MTLKYSLIHHLVKNEGLIFKVTIARKLDINGNSMKGDYLPTYLISTSTACSTIVRLLERGIRFYIYFIFPALLQIYEFMWILKFPLKFKRYVIYFCETCSFLNKFIF